MYSFLMGIIRKNKFKFAASSALGVLSGLGAILMLRFIGEMANDPAAAGVRDMFIMFLFAIVVFLSGVMSQFILNKISRDTLEETREFVVSKVSGSALECLEEIGHGKLISSLSQDANVISSSVLCIPQLVSGVFSVLAGLVFISKASWVIFFLLTSVIVSGVCISVALNNMAAKSTKESLAYNEKLFQNYKGIIDGAKELRINNHINTMLLDRIKYQSGKVHDLGLKAMNIFSVNSQLGQFLLFIFLVELVFIGKSVVDDPGREIQASLLVATYLVSPVAAVLASISLLTKLRVSYKRLSSYHDLKRDDVSSVMMSECEERGRELLLSAVTYEYERSGDSSFSVGPIDLLVRGGDSIFFVGGNGSGKSTILKVISGLYKPTTGKVVYRDGGCSSSGCGWVRQNVSAVFFDFMLFDGLPVTEEDYRLREAKVASLMSDLGLDKKTSIGLNGYSNIRLSQGQRRRIALLNSFMENKNIFVFDEWASDQDPEFRRYFYKKFIPSLMEAGKIVILATHDDRYFNVATKVVKMDKGVVVGN